ncbi:MAG TPA: dihydrofolate reductase [Bacteroidia bacterium]|nr:dihydrofolate reductase [Bacteroidia bacterium]
MIIAAIYAADLDNAIGKNNQLLWHLPADLKFFKTTTMGCPIIMGRKTYESMGRLLPGRKNIIITRSSDYRVEGAEIFHSTEAAIKFCRNNPEINSEKIFVIGGAEIFKTTLAVTTEIYRTLVKAGFEADVFVPEIDRAEFNLSWEECHEADEKNKYAYCFQKWERVHSAINS